MSEKGTRSASFHATRMRTLGRVAGADARTAMAEPLMTGRIELHSWRDFTKVMKIMEAGKWIYRGHEDASWSLETGLDRYLKKFGKAGLRGKDGSRDDLFALAFPRAEYFAISRFRAMSREYKEWESNAEALIAMQHYGAKTRLLDFTTSIMVALFFAYENRSNGKERAIYAINYGSLLVNQNGMWSKYKEFLKEKAKWVDRGDEQARWVCESQIENDYFRQFAFEEANKIISENKRDGDIDIIPLYTVCSNKRQMAQTGIELMPRTFDWFDKNLAAALKVPIKEVNHPSCLVSSDLSRLTNAEKKLPTKLIKFIFDARMEKDAWQMLDQANINAATIYPDLVGIAKSIRYSNNTVMIDDVIGGAKASAPVTNFWIPRDKICVCSLSDTISSVIDRMIEGGYSHVPVLDGVGKVIGVFSESTMMEAWKANIRCADAATMNDLAAILPIDNHKMDVFEFVSQDATSASLQKVYKESFENNERIGLIFVTENGNPNEPLLGIVTVWDIGEALNEKDNNNADNQKKGLMA